MKQRTYVLSPASAELTRIVEDPISVVKEKVPFKDVSVTVTASPGRNNYGWLSALGMRGARAYEVLLTTPAWRGSIWSSFQNDVKDALREAAEVRHVIGQDADSLLEDSVAQMNRDGNEDGAVFFRREATPPETFLHT